MQEKNKQNQKKFLFWKLFEIIFMKGGKLPILFGTSIIKHLFDANNVSCSTKDNDMIF